MRAVCAFYGRTVVIRLEALISEAPVEKDDRADCAKDRRRKVDQATIGPFPAHLSRPPAEPPAEP